MEPRQYVKLFANCKLVTGAKRGLLCDLQHMKSYYVPNELIELSRLFDSNSVGEIKERYAVDSHHIIDEYIAFLVGNNYAFYLEKDELSLFPSLSLEWDYPAAITNSIIDLDSNSKFDIKDIFEQLDELGCQDLQLRINNQVSINFLEDVLNSLNQLAIKSVQVFLPNDEAMNDDHYIALALRHPRLTALYIYSSGLDKLIAEEYAPGLIIARVTDHLKFPLCCGVIDKAYFTTNKDLFTEAHHFNTCLNRKISVDANGDIKNCPSATVSFGNVCNTKLADALIDQKFKQFWNIRKDEVRVCQDCEYRYICTDCRIYLSDPNDPYSKPLKCNYDPYSGEWLTESKTVDLVPAI